MARLLVCIIHLTRATKRLQAAAPAFGDVISVRPDSTPWGTEELRVDFLRCLESPGVDPVLFTNLREANVSDIDETLLVNSRAMSLDIDQIQKDEEVLLGRSLVPTDIIIVTKTRINDLSTTKVREQDPDIIGDSDRVIG